MADSESNLLIISILGEYQFKTNRRSFLAKWGFWKSQEFFGTVSEKWAYVYYVVLVPNLMFFFFLSCQRTSTYKEETGGYT